ncbi:uncharacterized protein [Tiliqua scincoides]|uniref:uncharacterized protein n=1 Tax=Tiliqua scincoides TaxID=71010 RepID=UPI00346252BE
MAPWIKLSIAKPLPTINEALEDLPEDKTNSSKGNVCLSPDSCTGEDYLQSICQLARPAFPLPSESKHKGIDKRAMLYSGHRASNRPETPQMVPKYKLTDSLPNLVLPGKNGFIFDHVQTYSSSRADPLEELYTESQKTHQWRCLDGNENTSIDSSPHSCRGTSLAMPPEKMRADLAVIGFPRLPSPRPMQRETSCPDLKSLRNEGKMPSLQTAPHQKEKDPLMINGKSIWLYVPRENPLGAQMLRSPQRGQQPLNVTSSLDKEQLKSYTLNKNVKRKVGSKDSCLGHFYTDPKATSRHWISEYQCAWKEAKVRAGLLPAIAEA